EFIHDASWAAYVSPRARDELIHSFGPHLRFNFLFDVDKADFEVFKNTLPSYVNELEWARSALPRDAYLLRRDEALRSFIRFEELPEIEKSLDEDSRAPFRKVYRDLRNRRGPDWLFQSTEDELFYLDDVSELASFNAQVDRQNRASL